MPSKRKRVSSKKWPSRRKKARVGTRNRNLQKLTIVRNPTFLGPAVQMDLVYATTISLDPSVATVAYHTFALNGMYDPDITGTGHQPRGFDQIMLLYRKYQVTKCHVEALAQHVDTNQTYALAMYPDAASTAPSSVENVLERNAVVWQYCASAVAGAGGESTALQMDVDVVRFMGGHPKGGSDLDFRGTSSANPSQLAYFHLVGWSPDAADIAKAYVTVRIVFTATFYQQSRPAES